MKTVNVAELKNNLSHYLKLARRGESILVRHRDQVIVRLEPVEGEQAGHGPDEMRLAQLEQRGILRRAKRRLPADAAKRRVQTTAPVLGALLEEREQGR